MLYLSRYHIFKVKQPYKQLSVKRKPPSFQSLRQSIPNTTRIKLSPKPPLKPSTPAYLTAATITGGIGISSIYCFEKFKKENHLYGDKFVNWLTNKKQTKSENEIYKFWNKYKADISFILICGLPVFIYARNSIIGFQLKTKFDQQLNAIGFLNYLNKIELRRAKGMNSVNTLSEIFHRTFSHSGIIHLALNTYLSYSLIDVSLTSRRDQWDCRHLCAAFFGGLFSSSIAAKSGQLGLGFSGGVYAILGYFYASESLKHLRFNLIFDINNNWPFGLSDFGSKWIPIETSLAVLQAFGLKFSPIGHIAHVSGFFYGVLAYYIFQEVYRPGYIQMVIRSKQEQIIDEIQRK